MSGNSLGTASWPAGIGVLLTMAKCDRDKDEGVVS